MYAKLFRNNIRKSLQDYILYFFTLVISSTLFFAFLSLTSRFNHILNGDGNYSLNLFQNTIRYAVLAVSVIFIALVQYINTFMLRQRSREFSVYLILGMEPGTAAGQFFGETLVFGLAAVFAGCVCGSALSGIITTFVKSTITGEAQFCFGFYPDTILQTVLFFLAVFVLVGVRNARRIYKIRLADLINEKKQNEGQKRNKNYYIFSFILTFVSFGFTGMALYQFSHVNGVFAGNVPADISNRYQAVAIVSAITGIFALYNALGFVLTVLRKRSKWKLRGTYPVLIGNLVQKVSQTAKVLSIATLAITISLVGFVILPMTAEITSGYLEYRMPYQIMINNNYRYIEKLEDIPKIDYTFVRDILKKHGIELTEEVTQESYFIWEHDFNSPGTRKNWRDLPRLAMRISDYNDMRRMAGYPAVSLPEQEFFMHIDYELDKEKVEAGISSREIRLDDGTRLKLAETAVYNERLGEYLFHMDGTVLVFPDSVCDRLHLARSCYYANTKTTIPYAACDTVRSEIESNFREKYAYLFDKYETKYRKDKNYISFIEPIRFWTQENNDTALTAVSVRLLGIYSGVIFFIICMTVLALHMITAAYDWRGQYQTLFQIGVEKEEIMNMVRKQSLIYFFTPCVAAFLIALLMIYSFALRYGHKVFTYMGTTGFQFGVIIPSLLIVIILSCYYGAAMYTINKKLADTLDNHP